MSQDNADSGSGSESGMPSPQRFRELGRAMKSLGPKEVTLRSSVVGLFSHYWLYWFSWLFLVWRIMFICLFLSKTGLPFARLHYSAFKKKIFLLVFYLVFQIEISYLLQARHPFQICIIYTQSVSPTPQAKSPQQRCVPLHSRVHILLGKTQKHRIFFHLGK